MKKMILLAAIVLSIAAMAQEPVLTFEKTTHDFGKINEADGRVTTIFEFTNEGMVPLVLTNVRASCGCTTPKWTHEPIEPGQKGNITVTYNPNGRPGRFQKTVTITSNATEPTQRIYIKGEVIPKPATSSEQYPITMGVLKLKKKTHNFGSMTRGSKRTVAIEYANTTNTTIHVGCATDKADTYIKALATLKEVKPGEKGELQLTIASEECPVYGPITSKVYVIVNGKEEFTDAYAITLRTDIKQDFSQMTVEQLQQAPILEVESSINMGTVKVGKKLQSKLTLGNIGINPMTIHRVVVNDTALKAVMPKTPIKSSKKADIKLEVTANKAGHFSRVITIICDDPSQPVKNITVEWTVE